jgi:mannosylglycoprotein endo-beta-mannosidase
MKTKLLFFILLALNYRIFAQLKQSLCVPSSRQSVLLRSSTMPGGTCKWQMRKAGNADKGEELSVSSFKTYNWLPATVPGTVLNSLVKNRTYPEPYYGDNNRISRKLIPDITEAGIEFYHYWFRTSFKLPKNFTGKRIWLKFHGINYQCNIWVNGKKIGKMAGMFNTENYDITDLVKRNGQNVLAVNVLPVQFPGSYRRQSANRPGAAGENHNGGDGEIGKDVTMLMSVGWDFTSPDGIRDRNTGIWRDVELYSTGDVILENPFVQTKLPLPDTTSSKQTVSVELKNASNQTQRGILTGSITKNGSFFSKSVTLEPNETKKITLTPEIYKQLTIKHPKLWWPINKGEQNLYTLNLEFRTATNGLSHTATTRFGIRQITSDQNTPDHSRRFLVNGEPVFIRGTNWVPEAMLRNTEQRTYAELRYTKQAGINLLRLWAGGVSESDYFYQLCDELGLMVWNEFWITGDTKFPMDTALYLKNLKNTVKRIRNHASVAYYVAANESDEIPGTAAVIQGLDPSHGYQVQSECCGIHDGSPYKYENPMQYFENTASRRGSRVDGFNPEYGTPCIPIFESLKKMMPQKDLWPINDSVWNYLDGNGFHQVTTKYREAVNAFGVSSSIEEFAKKAQFVGALNYRAIWEVWNYNKFNYGDRWASGFLFWYHNSPLPQTASRMYDWYLEPTAALYYSQNGLAPLHPQFDYLKNTVSVYNDYRKAFNGYTVNATVYDINSKQVSMQSATINIPADGVVNDALRIVFPSNITSAHFIKLTLKDKLGKLVADAFYWRSKDAYKGAWTMTGPAVSGFEEINKLPKAKLDVIVNQHIANNKGYLQVTVNNTSSSLSFFTQLKLQNSNGKNLAPTFYSDNFFSLLPGEHKTVNIEIPLLTGKEKVRLITDSFNANAVVNNIR